jgi:hypothetical protein
VNRKTATSLTLLVLTSLAMWQQDRFVAAKAAPMPFTFTVTSTADSGAGSLREALGLANSNAGSDLISFDAVVFTTPQTITLMTSELQISDSVTISGPGASMLTVSGNNSSRIFNIGTGPYDVTISGLTLANGMSVVGGGISNSSAGTVTLSHTVVSGNSANNVDFGFFPGYGGGILNVGTGTFTVTNSILSGNSANGNGGGVGGGIFSTGTLTLINSTAFGNSANGVTVGANGLGGGIFANGGTLTLINSTLASNFANGTQAFGGGIFNTGTVTITNSRLSSNSANGLGVGLSGFGQGGGIYNEGGTVTITSSTLSTNSAISGPGGGGLGGGIFNWSGTVALINSTLSANSANGGPGGFGGGIFNFSSDGVTITNSTLSRNSANGGVNGFGGGIYNSGQVTLANSTLSGNAADAGPGGFSRGGGIYTTNTLSARNTIVAGNIATPSAPDTFGTFTSQGHNLIGDGTDGSGFAATGDQVGTSASPINALLAPLADNGGPTQTHALLAGSPAINGGDNCVTQNPGCLATPLTTDQRGTGFSRNSGGSVDIGAFEVQQVVPAVGPGQIPDARSALSDHKAGSVLFFNIHTSSTTSPNTQDTRINVTNTNPGLRIFVHLFFVDGATCSVADSFLCLTPNETTSFLASSFDPGTTGYVVAVASDGNGCPANFNYLIGDEYVKFSTGHAASLGAEAISALPGGLPLCDASSDTAVLPFNDVSYNAVPRVLALDNIQARADGNDTLLVLNRFGGNLATGAATLNNVFGIAYNDGEVGSSFGFSPGTCQFRAILSNSFPRTVPRLETIIPAGQTGWMKLFATSDIGLLGATINFNANAGASAGAFSQGHNLHKLRLTTSMVLTIPIFPPRC